MSDAGGFDAGAGDDCIHGALQQSTNEFRSSPISVEASADDKQLRHFISAGESLLPESVGHM